MEQKSEHFAPIPFSEYIRSWGQDIAQAQFLMDAHVIDIIAKANKEEVTKVTQAKGQQKTEKKINGEVTITTKDGAEIKINLATLAKFYQFTDNSQAHMLFFWSKVLLKLKIEQIYNYPTTFYLSV